MVVKNIIAADVTHPNIPFVHDGVVGLFDA
jgi:hypothetical protein